MTLEELLDCDADRLEKMDDEELKVHLSKYFPTTRPEMAPRVHHQQQDFVKSNPKLMKGLEIAKQLGVDISVKDLFRGRKK